MVIYHQNFQECFDAKPIKKEKNPIKKSKIIGFIVFLREKVAYKRQE